MCLHLLVHELQDNASTILWRQAATRWQSAGIENGVAYAYTMKLLWKYRREKINDKAGALETILTGACWSRDRKCQAGIYTDNENICPKCGVSPCDDLHQYWTCEHLAQDEHDDVRKTQQYAPRAQEEFVTNPALWLRGILPASLLLTFPIPPPISATEISTFDPLGLTAGMWPSGTYGTDASGGAFSSIPEIRRCG